MTNKADSGELTCKRKEASFAYETGLLFYSRLHSTLEDYFPMSEVQQEPRQHKQCSTNRNPYSLRLTVHWNALQHREFNGLSLQRLPGRPWSTFSAS
jgi:hypothetical protein